MTYMTVRPQRRWAEAERNFNRMMNEFFGNSEDDNKEVVERVWVPRVDILESENEYRVHMDMPGVKKENVDITVEDGVLTISGERKWEVGEDERSVVGERAHGKFSRRFKLDNAIDAEKIGAGFDSGVLTIHLPKAEVAKPRRIEISGN